MIYIKQANTENFTLGPIKHCDGSPIDLSAATVKMIIKKDVSDDDSAAVITKESIHPESNIVLFSLSADETAVVPLGEFYIAFKIFWDNGIEREIFNDLLICEKGVFNE
jgi:hypothetical protein